MKKINIGIIGTADIAFRRFLPALKKHDSFNYIGVASRKKGSAKANKFKENFGGKIYENYDDIINDEDIDALYIPLPPALHYEWAKKALEKGKHVFLEKPSTTKLKDTIDLIEIAKGNNLALKENYMFIFHKQIERIKEIFENETFGKTRLIRASFGFPMRSKDDFRYNKALGGGALLDCGGYPIRLIMELLGDDTKLIQSSLYYEDGFEVDLYGDVVLTNGKVNAQISFGMDNEYRCEVELWSSKGYLKAPRVFTPPVDYDVYFDIVAQNEVNTIDIGCDDQFYNSINHFKKCILDENVRNKEYKSIKKQIELVSQIQSNDLKNINI